MAAMAQIMSFRYRHRFLGLLVAIWLVLTAASLVARFVIWNQLTEAIQVSRQAAEMDVALGQLFSALLDAESSQRGYLLTGDNKYLAPFKQAEAILPQTFNGLAALAPTDRSFQQDVLDLKGLTETKLDEMRETVRLRNEKGLPEALELVGTDKGKEVMEKIRTTISRLRHDRLNLFSNAGELTHEHLESAQRASAVVGFLGFGAGLFALYLVRIGYLQDQSQRELMVEKQRAEKRAAEKSDFLANVSHEIRTPMNAILGFGELLESEPLTPRQAQYIRSIRQSGNSLLQLINDVLDLSKLEAGKLEAHLEPTDAQELMGFLRTMFSHQAAVKSLQLTFEAEALPQALLLDRLRLRQVLVNLVGNALKYTERGQVCIRARWQPSPTDRSHGKLAFEVQDTGIGIPPEKQKEIFQPFVQSGMNEISDSQGTGLGLSIVQRLTQLMGGAISLESTPGQGSVFRLEFPNVQISARLPVTDAVEGADAVDFNDFAPATLLAVDDNEMNRDLIAGIFEGTHHRLRLARHGKDALESLRELKPDLVLMDIRMPIMDGRATLVEIRQLPAMEMLPVIAVTASGQAHEEGELRGRFNGYIRKPFSRRVLYEELAQFLPRMKKAGEPTGQPAPTDSFAPPVATAKKAASWEALGVQLRALQMAEWAQLCESLAINDTQAFARKLYLLAQTSQCPPLASFAQTLAAHAEMYAVHSLELHLATFPALIQAIEQADGPLQ